MSKTAKNQQGQKPKISRLATVSVGLSIFGLIYVSVVIPPAASFISWWIGLALAFAGAIVGILALIYIRGSKDRLAGRVFASLGMMVNTFLIVALLLVVHPSGRAWELARRVTCLNNLKSLGRTMLVYANAFEGKYPTCDQWCDLLIQHAEANQKQFLCRAAGRGPCHYAINPNCEPNSSRDVVLLFETKAGWNQFGGPELLTTENHRGEGCTVLFNDGHVEFVKAERLGQLKWKVGEDTNIGVEKKP